MPTGLTNTGILPSIQSQFNSQLILIWQLNSKTFYELSQYNTLSDIDLAFAAEEANRLITLI